ncbi:GDSL-type esterase/lipase family protein [Egbenema bharatensis]|uniref:GDSL-type esterase/lipase family protein n=1 Tax=Egbenema bharatensis TaxID=3463334 RepID=UPI003A8C5921
MSELCLLAVSLLVPGQAPGGPLTVPISKLPSSLPAAVETGLARFCNTIHPKTVAKDAITSIEVAPPEFSSPLQLRSVSYSSESAPALPAPPISPTTPSPPDAAISDAPSSFLPVAPARPLNGGQLYQQRQAALQAGATYTRLPTDSFQEQWMNTAIQPTYDQWVRLLNQEAQAMAGGQGDSKLSVMIGDSLSLWFPPELLTGDRFWLNQGISGDTTMGVLQRLSAIRDTNPDTIHVMVGINDLRRGSTDTEVVSNLREIMRQLRYHHPNAQVIVHSILPTRLAALPTDRIRRLNYMIANAAEQEGTDFLNLHYAFNDEMGILRRDLTTDGIHLSLRGYESWGAVMASIF